MIRFCEFLNEGGYHVPVVSISKDKIDLSNSLTRDEINTNLSAVLSQEWNNPYCGLQKVSKILSSYGINLPKIILDSELEDEVVIVLNQFGETIGANLDGSINTTENPDVNELYLIYTYELSDNGFIQASAKVVTESELDKELEQNDDTTDESNTK